MTRHRIPLLALGLVATAFAGCGWWSSEDRDVTCASEEAYAAYREGIDQNYRFHPEKAFEALKEATALDPDFVMAQMHLALTAKALGRRDFADSVLTVAYDRREAASQVEQLVVARVYAIQHGEHEKGMEIYRQLVELAPENQFVLRLRAEDARREQKWREAIALYDRILEDDPEAIEMHNLKGYAYISLGEYDNAIHSLQRYAYYAPDNANPHDSLGEAYLYEGRYEGAIEEFMKALEIEPTFVWSGVHLANALGATGQFRRAQQTLEELRPVFEERQQMDWMRTEKLKLAFMAEDWEQLVTAAEAELPFEGKTTLQDTEHHFWVHYARTAGYLELGNLSAAHSAVADLQAMVDELSEKAAAYGILDSVFEINRAYLESRFARFEGEPERGLPALRKAIANSRLSPHELASFRYELAEGLLAAGRAAEAAEVSREVLDRIPTAPRMNLLAAKAYQTMGDRESALGHLRTYLEVMRFADEGNPRVAEATRLLQQMVPRS